MFLFCLGLYQIAFFFMRNTFFVLCIVVVGSRDIKIATGGDSEFEF